MLIPAEKNGQILCLSLRRRIFARFPVATASRYGCESSIGCQDVAANHELGSGPVGEEVPETQCAAGVVAEVVSFSLRIACSQSHRSRSRWLRKPRPTAIQHVSVRTTQTFVSGA